MTIARDVHTNAVRGQVVDAPPSARVQAYFTRHPENVVIRILTRDGYQYVPRSSVRLEEVSDA